MIGLGLLALVPLLGVLIWQGQLFSNADPGLGSILVTLVALLSVLLWWHSAVVTLEDERLELRRWFLSRGVDRGRVVSLKAGSRGLIVRGAEGECVRVSRAMAGYAQFLQVVKAWSPADLDDSGRGSGVVHVRGQLTTSILFGIGAVVWVVYGALGSDWFVVLLGVGCAWACAYGLWSEPASFRFQPEGIEIHTLLGRTRWTPREEILGVKLSTETDLEDTCLCIELVNDTRFLLGSEAEVSPEILLQWLEPLYGPFSEP